MSISGQIPWEYKQIQDDQAAVLYVFTAPFRTEDGLVEAWITYRTPGGQLAEDWMVADKDSGELSLASHDSSHLRAVFPGELASLVVRERGVAQGSIVVRFEGVLTPVFNPI